MLNLRPPQNAIDDPVHWVSPSDPVWSDKIKEEQIILGDAAVDALDRNDFESDDAFADKSADVRNTAELTHPVTVWLAGQSRFSFSAPLTVPEAIRNVRDTVTVDDYMDGDPTVFEIKPLGFREWRKAMTLTDDNSRWESYMIRHGLIMITGGDEPIEPDRGSDGLISWAWLDWLDSYSRALTRLLAWAVYNASQGQSERGKP